MSRAEGASAKSSEKLRVSPSEIEGALDRIRRTADAADSKQSGARQRATLSNLIILTSSSCTGSMRGAIDSLVQSLCVVHPSRFFIVEFEPAAGEKGDDRVNQYGVGTSVSSRCVLAESGAHICSEEVYLTVNEKGVKLAPNLLLSLFVSGVEIVLLVLDDPLAAPQGEASNLRGFRELYEALRALSRTVVYDSGSFSSYVQSTNLVRGLGGDDRETLGLSGTAAVAGGASTTVNKSGTRYRDISLYRSARWRELIAEGFDVERMQASIDAVTEVTIHSTKPATTSSGKGMKVSGPATLLGSWIASCLGWNPERAAADKSGTSVTCAGRVRETVLRFVEVDGDRAAGQPGGADPIVAVEFSFDPSVYQGSMRLARQPEHGAIELTVMGCSAPKDAAGHDASCDFYVRQVPGKPQPLEQLVMSGIVSQRQDQQSEEAIRLATRLADCLK